MNLTINLVTAAWCAPCKQLKPKLAAYAEEEGINLNIIDIETNPELAPDTTSVPTVWIEVKGETYPVDNRMVAIRRRVDQLKNHPPISR